ncbi:hypothetical protein [Hoeflea sp. BAL378]|uniref:hypothetical protein n=1 Tax=Hoeflea sp. BAL378 TaxID=1547437 RepID=UPI00126A680B|nr:hypothetical protein [Hoeflea sp. BAL378]
MKDRKEGEIEKKSMEVAIYIILMIMMLSALGIIYPYKPFKKRTNAFIVLVICFIAFGVMAPEADSSKTGKVSNKVAEAKEEMINVPSDPKAKYFVVKNDTRVDGMVEVTTRREGPSGTSFAIRLIQCEPLLSGYIAEGDTVSDLTHKNRPTLSELVDGSISDVIAKYACIKRLPREPLQKASRTIEPVEDGGSSKRARIEQAVRESLEAHQWIDAKNHYQRLVISEITTAEFAGQMEAHMLRLVKPIPASEYEINLQGYEFLVAVQPKKNEYQEKVRFYKESIENSRKRLISRLRVKEDKVEGVTWFKHPNEPKYLNSRSTVYLYIGRKGKSGTPWLRMKIQYTSTDWLFVENVKAWYDGAKETLFVGRFERDNNTTIWEWVDISPKSDQIELLRSIAKSKESILRFEGNQYHRDVKLSAGDKAAIRDVLEAYEIMKGKN